MTRSKRRPSNAKRPARTRGRTVIVSPIHDEADYDATLSEVDTLMDAEPGTAEGDRLEVLVTLIEAYEAKHWSIDPPDPIDALLLRMEQRGLTRADLHGLLGSSGRVSEIL